MTSTQMIGLLGVVAIAACWGFAVILYRVGGEGSVARMLSVVLVAEGMALVTAQFPDMLLGIGDKFYDAHPTYKMFAFTAHTIADAAVLALYPPFLAAALKTKFTRPFARKKVQMALYAYCAALVPAVILSPLKVGATLLYGSLSLLFSYALVAAINAWYLARGANRARARSFAFAFGIRDICWGFVYAASIYMIYSGMYIGGSSEFGYKVKIVYALGTLLAIPLIAYGILRAHLFDIDLKIQWTIKQSTLAAIIITFIFLVSEGADRLFSAELGNWAGLIAAAIVVFFLTPLQHFAENVASKAMPNTRNTPEYAVFRKMQMYEEAVAEAHYEGGISDKERSLLNRLRESLEITEADADAIEADIRERLPVTV